MLNSIVFKVCLRIHIQPTNKHGWIKQHGYICSICTFFISVLSEFEPGGREGRRPKILISQFGVSFAFRGYIPLGYWNPKSLGGEKIGPFICHWYSGQSPETDLQLFNTKHPIRIFKKVSKCYELGYQNHAAEVWFLKIYIPSGLPAWL